MDFRHHAGRRFRRACIFLPERLPDHGAAGTGTQPGWRHQRSRFLHQADIADLAPVFPSFLRPGVPEQCPAWRRCRHTGQVAVLHAVRRQLVHHVSWMDRVSHQSDVEPVRRGAVLYRHPFPGFAWASRPYCRQPRSDRRFVCSHRLLRPGIHGQFRLQRPVDQQLRPVPVLAGGMLLSLFLRGRKPDWHIAARIGVFTSPSLYG